MYLYSIERLLYCAQSSIPVTDDVNPFCNIIATLDTPITLESVRLRSVSLSYSSNTDCNMQLGPWLCTRGSHTHGPATITCISCSSATRQLSI